MVCIFCQIIEGKIPAHKVYEDNEFLAFLDISPVNPGHALVIPKAHYPDLPSAPDEVLSGLMPVVKKVGTAIVAGVGAGGFNLQVNNGRVAGQVVDHVHVHVMPRRPNDGHKLWSGKPYAEGEAAAVAEKIKSAIK